MSTKENKHGLLYPERVINKIALIAGNGKLPREVLDSCLVKGIECTVIGLKDNVDVELFSDVKCDVLAMSEVSKILKTIKANGCRYVVMAGGVKRIPIVKLLLDFKAAKLMTMLIKGKMHDSSMLKTIVAFLEGEGLEIVAPDDIASDIKMKKGNITSVPIKEVAMEDIAQGYKILKDVGKYGIGQSLVIQQGLVLGFEGPEGTDALIERCGKIQQQGNVSYPVLVKVMGPHQHEAVDLPCIGPKTISMLAQYNIQGVAVEAGHSLIIDKDETKRLAQELGIFVYGIH